MCKGLNQQSYYLNLICNRSQVQLTCFYACVDAGSSKLSLSHNRLAPQPPAPQPPPLPRTSPYDQDRRCILNIAKQSKLSYDRSWLHDLFGIVHYMCCDTFRLFLIFSIDLCISKPLSTDPAKAARMLLALPWASMCTHSTYATCEKVLLSHGCAGLGHCLLLVI